MKSLKFLLVALMFLLSFKGIYALAVSQLMPTNMTLKVGESLTFNFEIQAINSGEDQLCTYSVNDLNSLITNFREEKTVVKAGGTKQVFGTIEVPSNSHAKEYSGKLVVSCNPTGTEGGSVIAQTLEASFKVNVVKVEGTDRRGLMGVLIIAIIVILLFLFKVKHKKRYRKTKKKNNLNREIQI